MSLSVSSSPPQKKTFDMNKPVWSNFEIADLDFWRSEAYMKFFDYLEAQGGFYYEVRPKFPPLTLTSHIFFQRWGDAPVHSIAAALFKSKDQIHFFHDIGYEHPPYNHCPVDVATWQNGRCSCGRSQSFGTTFPFLFYFLNDNLIGTDYEGYSCMSKWDRFMEKRR